MTGKLLLVEDHHDLANTVIQSLESAGFTMDYASTGPQGLLLATTEVFDTVILDIMLPGMDGLEICERLRNEYGIDTPVLMLTARDELGDKLAGFEHGADDYLVKPFQMQELIARVASLVKRKRGSVGSPVREIRDLLLDTSTMTVRRAGQKITLSPIAFNILNILMRESPSIVSRDSIEHELWGEEPPDSDALRSHIYTLRKAVDKPFKNEMIKTIKGVGLKIDQ